MTERNTRIKASQISEILPSDIEAINSVTDLYVPRKASGQDKWEWIQVAGGVSDIEDLDDVDFDSGTPIDGHCLRYDNNTSKWKSDFPRSLEDADNDTKIQVEESADEDKIRFDTGGIERALLDSNGLKLASGADINEFSTDGTFADNSDDAVPTEKAVKTYLSTNYGTLEQIVTNQDNIALLAFYRAVDQSKSIFNMVDGIVDEYEDESGIDTVNSINQNYNSTGDYYSPIQLGTPYTHYKCNDDAGNTTVTDDGSGSNNGTASTNTSNLSVAGKINDAFEFNGTNEYINLDVLEQDIDSDTSGTICFWFKTSSINNERVFAVADTDGLARFTITLTSFDSKITIAFIDNTGTDQWVIKSSVISTNTWYHLVLSHNGTEATLYIDGEDDTNFTVTTDKTYWFADEEANLDNARLACANYNSGGNSGFFAGIIDDFRYYKNTALSEDEADSIYNSGNGSESSQFSTNMTLISDLSTSAESEPDSGRLVVHEEDVDAITLNTDLKAYASRDGGSTWAEGTLVDEGDYEPSKRILTATFDFTASGIGSGTDIEYKLVTANSKDLKIHGSSIWWT